MAAILLMATSLCAACIPTLPPAPAAGSGADAADTPDVRADGAPIAPNDVGSADGMSLFDGATGGDGGSDGGEEADSGTMCPGMLCPLGKILIGCVCAPAVSGLADLVARCDDRGTPLGWRRPTPEVGPENGEVPPAEEPLLLLPQDPPIIIDEPGDYLLAGDLESDHGAVLIASADVRLDLGGHTITYGQAEAVDDAASFGVRIDAGGARPVTVFNGRIIQGDGTCNGGNSSTRCAAIYIDQAVGVLLDGLELRSTSTRATAVHADHDGDLEIRRCLIDDQSISPPMSNHATVAAGNSSSVLLTHNVIQGSQDWAVTLSSGELTRNEFRFGDGSQSAHAISRSIGNSLPIVSENVFIGRGGAPTAFYGGGVYMESNYLEMQNDVGGFDGSNAGSNGIDYLGAVTPGSIACNWFDVGAGEPIESLEGTRFGGRSWGVAMRLSGAVLVENNYVRATDSSEGSALAAAVQTTMYAREDTQIENNVFDAATGVVLGAPESSAGDAPLFSQNHFIVPSWGTLVSDYPAVLYGPASNAHGVFSQNHWEVGSPCDSARVSLAGNCSSGGVERYVTFDPSGETGCTYSNLPDADGTEIDASCGLHFQNDP